MKRMKALLNRFIDSSFAYWLVLIFLVALAFACAWFAIYLAGATSVYGAS